MILIISTVNDYSTNSVIDWLNKFNVEYVRINETSEISVKKMQISNNEVKIILLDVNNNTEIDLDKINAVWYRRGWINLSSILRLVNKKYYEIAQNELEVIENIIWKVLYSKKHLNKFEDNSTNKLYNLLIAKKHGLNIPFSKIIKERNDLILLNKKHTLITKPVKFNDGYQTKKYSFIAGTSELNKKKTKKISETFFYSLVQQKIEKKYDIRVFFIDKQFYSVAIFSQSNNKTKIDFRNYDDDNPNRINKYRLPKNIITKLHKTMHEINLNSGSIDLVADANNKIYFLEVNPIGQFGWISKYCGVNIEKKIAQHLVKLNYGK